MCVTGPFRTENEIEHVQREEGARPAEREHWVCRWPIPRAALSTFVELGVSDDYIARYFKVGAADVETLRKKYRLSE
jgi:hypothetical protein